MAKVYIESKNFARDNGELIPYKRLCIEGHLDGQPTKLELKLTQTQMSLASALLRSDNLEVVTSKGGKVDVSGTPGEPGDTDAVDELFSEVDNSDTII